jgi:hypothetical protein
MTSLRTWSLLGVAEPYKEQAGKLSRLRLWSSVPPWHLTPVTLPLTFKLLHHTDTMSQIICSFLVLFSLSLLSVVTEGPDISALRPHHGRVLVSDLIVFGVLIGIYTSDALHPIPDHYLNFTKFLSRKTRDNRLGHLFWASGHIVLGTTHLPSSAEFLLTLLSSVFIIWDQSKSRVPWITGGQTNAQFTSQFQTRRSGRISFALTYKRQRSIMCPRNRRLWPVTLTHSEYGRQDVAEAGRTTRREREMWAENWRGGRSLEDQPQLDETLSTVSWWSLSDWPRLRDWPQNTELLLFQIEDLSIHRVVIWGETSDTVDNERISCFNSILIFVSLSVFETSHALEMFNTSKVGPGYMGKVLVP